MLHFIQTTHFVPINFQKLGFKIIDDNEIVLECDGSIWKAIELYDLGWGKEKGYYRTPMPSKEELFEMAFPTFQKNKFEDTFNYWGSISVLWDEYCDFLLEKLKEQIQINSIFKIIHKETIMYIDSELDVSEAIISKLSDKKIVENVKKWKQIKEDIRFFDL
jgi:hypothetical protein